MLFRESFACTPSPPASSWLVHLRENLVCSKLGFLQAIHNDVHGAQASFLRSLGGMLRYPGLCRYSCV